MNSLLLNINKEVNKIKVLFLIFYKIVIKRIRTQLQIKVINKSNNTKDLNIIMINKFDDVNYI
jgi:hypothetical protein